MNVISKFEVFKPISGFWLVENERNGGYDLVGGTIEKGIRLTDFTILFSLEPSDRFNIDLDLVFTDLTSAKAYLFDNNFKKAENNDSCS